MARHTPQVKEAYLFGSYAKGKADSDSDVDIAIKASAVDWTFRTAKWEEDLTKAVGVQVNIRELGLPVYAGTARSSAVPLKLD